MPYIKQEDRDHFICDIDDLISRLKINKSPGELNYVISSIVWELFDDNPSYTEGNKLVGVLECVKQEFIRRRLNPYEDEKIKSNGDL